MNGKSKTGQHGAALVESALVTLTFLIILFAIFESGRMMSIQQSLTNAAREGARLAVLPAWGGTDTLPSTTAVQARVQQFLDAVGLNGASANIQVEQCCDPSPNSCTAPPCTTGQVVYSRVRVTVPYRVVSISMFSLLEVNLQGQSTMRNETNLQ